MPLDSELRSWERGGYLVSTDPELLQIDEVNAALGSDLMWWAKALPHDDMRRALHNSLCFGLYALPTAAEDSGGSAAVGDAVEAGRLKAQQVGLARIVTDGVTFAYMTDVYILEGHQGKGLGRYLMECLNEVIQAMPHLRRFMLLSSNMMDLYRKTLGMRDFYECNDESIRIALVEGPGAQHPDH